MSVSDTKTHTKSSKNTKHWEQPVSVRVTRNHKKRNRKLNLYINSEYKSNCKSQQSKSTDSQSKSG